MRAVVKAVALVLVGLLFAFLPVPGTPAIAENGDKLRQIEGEYSEPCSLNTGLAFDGRNLILTCWYHNTLDFLDPANGDLVATLDVPGYSGLFAASWDSYEDLLWVCADHDTVITVNIRTGESTERFTAQGDCEDGLSYDPTDRTVWTSGDVKTDVFHWQRDGTLIETHSTSGLIGDCGNSGIAATAGKIYLANNGCQEIYAVDKDFSSSELFAEFSRRLEDLECDAVTFASEGKGALWSQDAYDRTINAWEIPLDRCANPPGSNGLEDTIPSVAPLTTGFDFPLGMGDCHQPDNGYVLEKYWVVKGGDFLDPAYKRDPDLAAWHPGEDWNRKHKNDYGDPVCAVGNGIVRRKSFYSGWGCVVVIEHRYFEGSDVRHVWSQYAHLRLDGDEPAEWRECDSVVLEEGEVVRRGQKVAEIGRGDPGDPVPSHLHFEMRRDGLETVPAYAFWDDKPRIEKHYHDPSDFDEDEYDGAGFIDHHRPPLPCSPALLACFDRVP